jgi:hypothetical protein
MEGMLNPGLLIAVLALFSCSVLSARAL